MYIGYASDLINRKAKHKGAKGGCPYLHNAIKKYGFENFSWEIIYQSLDPEHTLKVMEPHFIKEYDTHSTGYNLTLGGEGLLGYVTSEDTKQKQSLRKKGIPISEKHKENISRARGDMPKRTFSEKARVNMSHCRKGLPWTEARREAQRRRNNP